LRIAFDEQLFLLQEYGGISRYLCNLAQRLSRMPDVDVMVSAPLHYNRNLVTLQDVPGFRLLIPKLNSKLAGPVRAISHRLADMAINRFSPDIIHETYYEKNPHPSRGALRVLTVYDLIHERYGEMFENSHMTTGPKRVAAMRADHVICISESTRRDLVTICGVPEDKTTVIYLGANQTFLDAPPEVQSSKRPYVLYVGSRDGYKNFVGFLRAFASSSRLKFAFDVLCFGGGPFSTTELGLAREFGLRSDGLIHRFGSDEVLAGLYSGARAFVYPSLYEGFGLPPLEAMASSCPVICGNTSSIPEVVGDAGEYFEPRSLESIRSALETVVFSESRRTDLIALGKMQCRRFSWDKCAQETEVLYRKLLS
jgi:glycosyltransferase involved in cell wall biosynthesis